MLPFCLLIDSVPGVMQTLSVIRTWQTRVDVCVITDNHLALQLVLDRWTYPGVSICPYSTPLVQEERYSLLVRNEYPCTTDAWRPLLIMSLITTVCSEKREGVRVFSSSAN